MRLRNIQNQKELHPIFLKLMERFDLSYRVVLDPTQPRCQMIRRLKSLLYEQSPPARTKKIKGDPNQDLVRSLTANN